MHKLTIDQMVTEESVSYDEFYKLGFIGVRVVLTKTVSKAIFGKASKNEFNVLAPTRYLFDYLFNEGEQDDDAVIGRVLHYAITANDIKDLYLTRGNEREFKEFMATVEEDEKFCYKHAHITGVSDE